MCDTFVVVGAGEVLFGKNSDRDPNEAQIIEWFGRRASHGASLRCTWTNVPDVARTHAVVLSRPYWMWGAEMGANEHGVVIGNEAVFTRSLRSRHGGLLGMDLVRLGLERAASADEAVAVLEGLVAEHGQGGRAGYDDPDFQYDSSFLVADHRGAWIVETSGREVAKERVAPGVRAISNGLTIAPFAKRHADPLRGGVAECKARRGRVEALGKDARSPRDVARVLRDHGSDDGLPRYRWLNGAMGAPCVHGGGIVASSQTVGSWISRLTPIGAEHYVTATAAPCLSGFKPIHFDSPMILGCPTGIDDGCGPFWTFERLHRRLAGDPDATRRHQRLRDEWEAATWSGGRDPREAFASFEELLREASPSTVDTRPGYVRRYWTARERDARAAAPKLPKAHAGP